MGILHKGRGFEFEPLAQVKDQFHEACPERPTGDVCTSHQTVLLWRHGTLHQLELAADFVLRCFFRDITIVDCMRRCKQLVGCDLMKATPVSRTRPRGKRDSRGCKVLFDKIWQERKQIANGEF